MSPRDPHRDAGVPGRRPADGSPARPSRDDAAAAGSVEGMAAGSAAGNDERNRSLAEGRRDPEGSGDGERQKPHVTENEEGKPVQGDEDGDAPVLPANASGSDQVSTDDQPRTVDDESAYDRRPEQEPREG
jgi:hypothetical protein